MCSVAENDAIVELHREGTLEAHISEVDASLGPHRKGIFDVQTPKSRERAL